MSLRTSFKAGSAAVAIAAVTVLTSPSANAGSFLPGPINFVPGSFNTVQTTRILDTRSGLGAPKATVAPWATLTFAATASIENSVGAVALNVTAVNPTAPGYLTVFPFGTSRPLASNLNFQARQNVPNLVIAPVGTGGKVSIYNGSPGTINVLADIDGYFVGGTNAGDAGTFVSRPPQRFLDTRIGFGAPRESVAPFSFTNLTIAGAHGLPASISAAVVNVTAVQSPGRGFISVSPGTAQPGTPQPLTSSVNYLPRQDRANAILVQIGDDGKISLFNGSAQKVDLVVDITGYFVPGTPTIDGSFVPSTPFRVFDSRGENGQPSGALTTSKIQVFPANDPTFSIFKAVVVNVTAASPQASGFLTTWDGVGSLPPVSSSNFMPGQDAAGSVILPVNRDGTISVYNGSYGNVDLVVDVTGLFLNLPLVVGPNRLGAKADDHTAGQIAGQIARALSTLHKLSRTPAAVPAAITR